MTRKQLIKAIHQLIGWAIEERRRAEGASKEAGTAAYHAFLLSAWRMASPLRRKRS